MARFKLALGDVFTIPLGNGEVGFGQIVSFPNSKHAFIMCVFDYKQNLGNPISIEQICKTPILFLGYSTDAKLYHKDWEIVGNNVKNISSIVFPFHRLGTPPEDIYIVNYKGERLSAIDEDIFNKLSYQTNIAPIRYENALKAYYGLQEWKEEDYDKLLYKHSIRSKEIFENLDVQR